MAAVQPQQSFLREVELRLLRCTLPPPASSSPSPVSISATSHHLASLAASLLAAVERGGYAAALASAALFPHAFALTSSTEDEESAAEFYGEADRSAEAFLLSSTGDVDEAEYRTAVMLSAGVAALLAFTQCNITGHVGEFSPFPVPAASLEDGSKWDAWASKRLSTVGAHVDGKLSLLQYIIYAEILFTNVQNFTMAGGCPVSCESVYWWLSRTVSLHQKILDELSSSLYDKVQKYSNVMLLKFGDEEKILSYWGTLLCEQECQTIKSLAHLEVGIAKYKYGRIDDARSHFNIAEESCGLHLAMTGILGFRTIHQIDAKSQLVLVASTDERVKYGGRWPELSQAQNGSALENGKHPIPQVQDDSSEILRIPKLLQNGSGANGNGSAAAYSKNQSLNAIQQAVVLAQCLHLTRRSSDDELSKWEVAPYIELIDSQCQNYYAVRMLCHVLRVRWESNRSRTMQRALLMMDELVEQVSKSLPAAAQRIQCAYALYLPTITALRKEYSELLVSSGLIGDALRIFEDLELWDNLIYCYRLLNKNAEAIALINARLEVTPNDPRLWCSLGDITNTDAHYQKALELSGNRSARAMRSLARSAFERKDFKTSKSYWESALAINSLHTDGWFYFGMAAWKDHDTEKALEAYTRVVQIDPDNGEAWNNIACLQMRKGKSVASFNAFKEATKYKRNSWEVWDNFSTVAFDTGNLQKTLEAVNMVLTLTSNKRINVALLDRVMSKVEERSSRPCPSSTLINGAVSEQHVHPNSDESKQTEFDVAEPLDRVIEGLGNILQQAIKVGGNEDLWGLYARWHKIKGDLTMCSEALLKQVRSLQGSGLWHDEKRFKRYAAASLQLCEVYMQIASSTGNARELRAAEMHLKSSVKQARDFSSTEEYIALTSYLGEIRKRLGATTC